MLSTTDCLHVVIKVIYYRPYATDYLHLLIKSEDYPFCISYLDYIVHVINTNEALQCRLGCIN